MLTGLPVRLLSLLKLWCCSFYLLGCFMNVPVTYESSAQNSPMPEKTVPTYDLSVVDSPLKLRPYSTIQISLLWLTVTYERLVWRAVGVSSGVCHCSLYFVESARLHNWTDTWSTVHNRRRTAWYFPSSTARLASSRIRPPLESISWPAQHSPPACTSDTCNTSQNRPTAYTYTKLSYRRGTARCVVSVEILPIATQQCSTTSPEQIEGMKLVG